MADVVSAAVVGAGGAGVLGSYWALGKADPAPSYAKSSLWLGASPRAVTVLIILQLVAAIGFMVAIGTWIVRPPQTGLLGRAGAPAAKYALALTLGALLASSAAWSFAAIGMLKGRTGSRAAAVASTTVAAAATLVLIAGAVTEHPRRWWVVGGLVALGVTTVLADGVGWAGRALVH